MRSALANIFTYGEPLMTTTIKGNSTEPIEREALMMAQIRELQHIIELMLCGEVHISPPKLVADGITLVTAKQAMHITGLSRSAIQKLLMAKKIVAKQWKGRWFIDPATLPRPR
jgi:hypothetical protein